MLITSSGTVAANGHKTISNILYPVTLRTRQIRVATNTSYNFCVSTSSNNSTSFNLTLKNLTNAESSIYSTLLIGVGY